MNGLKNKSLVKIDKGNKNNIYHDEINKVYLDECSKLLEKKSSLMFIQYLSNIRIFF